MHHPPRTEALERRSLLSISLDPSTGLLTVVGTQNADRIELQRASTSTLRVRLNAQSAMFPQAGVARVIVNAGPGNDLLVSTSQFLKPVLADGGVGNDTLSAGGGNDTLLGGVGDDSLLGNNGNDQLDGQSGADFLSGGRGIDSADYSGRLAPVVVKIENQRNDGEIGELDDVRYDVEIVAGGRGNDTLRGSGAANTLIGNAGHDLLVGRLGSDLLDGSEGDDLLQAGGDNDTLRGGAGNDAFYGDGGVDTVDYSDHTPPVPGQFIYVSNEGEAFDGLRVDFVAVEFDNVFPSVENIIGSDGADQIVLISSPSRGGRVDARSGDDTISGGDGGDQLSGGPGDDQISGGPGGDLIAGDEDHDNLSGDGEDDTLAGGDGNDLLNGLDGHDVIAGGEGNDTAAGEAGNDSISGGSGDDSLSGGVGNDTLDGGFDSDLLDGGDDDDSLVDPANPLAPGILQPLPGYVDGAAGNDRIEVSGDQVTAIGGIGNDTLIGGAGEQALLGGDGDDVILGGDDGDFLVGDLGNDTLRGEAGNDVLVNADGLEDLVDGGPDIDQRQFEPAGNETVVDVELVYDLPEGVSEPDPDPETSPRAASAAPTPTLSGGKLTVIGDTPAADNIAVSSVGGDVVVSLNGGIFKFPRASVSSILVDTGQGDDVINCSGVGPNGVTFVNVTILGGRGNDLLIGSPFNDLLVGGPGNDALNGNAGDDEMFGGYTATLLNADGTDIMQGGVGRDSVSYAARTDNLMLDLDGVADDGAVGEGDRIGADVERLFGGRGNDAITGDGQPNFLDGGGGMDTLTGNAGNDIFVAAFPAAGGLPGDASDTVFGGSGADCINVRGDGVADRYNLGTPPDLRDVVSRDTGNIDTTI